MTRLITGIFATKGITILTVSWSILDASTANDLDNFGLIRFLNHYIKSPMPLGLICTGKEFINSCYATSKIGCMAITSKTNNVQLM